MTKVTIKQLEKEIEEIQKEQKELIKKYNLGKPYHAVDIWEEENVKEAKLQTLKDVFKELLYFEGLIMVNPKKIILEEFQELKQKIKGGTIEG